MLDQLPVEEVTPVEAGPVSALTLELLAWVARCPRSYEDAMEAWRTNCPRFPIWEDAVDDDLICLERARGLSMGQTPVTLTDRGRALLDHT
jgi:hypothetical protein